MKKQVDKVKETMKEYVEDFFQDSQNNIIKVAIFYMLVCAVIFLYHITSLNLYINFKNEIQIKIIP